MRILKMLRFFYRIPYNRKKSGDKVQNSKTKLLNVIATLFRSKKKNIKTAFHKE